MLTPQVLTPGSAITENELLGTNIAMIAVVSIVVMIRVSVQVIRRKKLDVQDYLVYVAFAFHLTMSILGVIITPLMYLMDDVALGKRPPYPGLVADTAHMAKLIFSGQLCFWFCLWAVKFSLLALYKNLMAGLPSIYMKAWWSVVGICLLSLVGILVADSRICSDMHAYLTVGKCNTPEDVSTTLLCMYFAYAADVFTDFLIMFLPLRLVWNLQMPTLQKIGVCLLFSSGILCIVFATIRVVNIGAEGGNHLDPKRTALWSVLETAIAIIVGCCPAFVALIRGRKPVQTQSHSAQRYTRRSGNRSSRYDAEKGIKLRSLVSSESRVTLSGTKAHWEHKSDSREELAIADIEVLAANMSDRDDAQSGISHVSSR